MAIIVKTGTTSSEYSSTPNYGTAYSMMHAIASAINSDPKNIDGSTISDYKAYVTMDPIGYPGWCVAIKMKDNDGLYLYICKTKSDGTPDFDDANQINCGFKISSSLGTANTIYMQPETCVMMHDENKDTVLFDVHPGATSQGVGLDKKRESFVEFTFFFAKDVNDDVLCGLGNGHIKTLRTENAKMDPNDSFANVSPFIGGSDRRSLHLTKMINYLSPGCPEMKSAYVSVVRPDESESSKLYISLLYADGKRWGRGGLVNSWNGGYSDAYPICCSYFPIEPFVNC